jgi:leucyl aminopeptidase (aminopeptidase T)
MGIEYDDVIAAGKSLVARLRAGRVIECTSAAGTALRISMPEKGTWIERLGELVPGKRIAFPAGALFASPLDVRGTFVADASVGEFFGAREGLLSKQPVTFTIAGGRVVRVDAARSTELHGNIQAMLRMSENSDRVGLVSIGVNAGVSAPTGEAVVDQTLASLHLFIGDPAGKATGASWSARSSFPVCQAFATVTVDGRVVLADGKVTP